MKDYRSQIFLLFASAAFLSRCISSALNPGLGNGISHFRILSHFFCPEREHRNIEIDKDDTCSRGWIKGSETVEWHSYLEYEDSPLPASGPWAPAQVTCPRSVGPQVIVVGLTTGLTSFHNQKLISKCLFICHTISMVRVPSEYGKWRDYPISNSIFYLFPTLRNVYAGPRGICDNGFTRRQRDASSIFFD